LTNRNFYGVSTFRDVPTKIITIYQLRQQQLD